MRAHWTDRYLRAFVKLESGEKISRKAKKAILGVRLSKTKIRRLIREITIINHGGDFVEVHPFEFCPNCGCRMTRTGMNMAEYPEVWAETYCLRCHKVVGSEDNGPYRHVLEDMVYAQK